jgi:single-strand DNA-binding protein
MTDTITLRGTVGTPPRHLLTSSGLSITSFRLASTQRRFDRQQNKWVDAETNWYTVSTFRQLAENTVRSVRVGDYVVVTGRLRLREWTNADKSGLNVDIEADSVGHDLAWGTSTWVRTPTGAHDGPPRTGDGAPADPAGGESWSDGASGGESSSGTAHDVTTREGDAATWDAQPVGEERVSTPF